MRVSAHCHILKTLGILLSIDAAAHEELSELNYVRNCLLHRGGIVDDGVATEAPNLGLATGASVHIGQASYLAYSMQ